MDELLKLLRNNALETPANLARMLATTEADVRQRIAEYERAGVIRGYQAVVNEDQLDLDVVHAVIEVKVSPEREGGFDRVAQRVSRFPEVDSVYLMSGTYDLLLFVTGRNLKDVATFVASKLASLDGVLSTATHFMLKSYKQHGILMESKEDHERLKVSP